jgi:hypothetical protein
MMEVVGTSETVYFPRLHSAISQKAVIFITEKLSGEIFSNLAENFENS